MKISIILPTYNEHDNIRNLIKTILKNVRSDLEVIVVDDNSPDKTGEVVIGMSSHDSRIKLIMRTEERGVASAIQDGIMSATGDVIVWMDCDFSHPPEIIPDMLSELRQYDIVIASRYAEGARDSRDTVRVLMSKMFNIVAQIILSKKVKDYTTGFVATKKNVFDNVSFSRHGHGEYCIEFLYKSIKNGFTVKEVPYFSPDRIIGKSKTSSFMYISLIKYAFIYMKKVLSLRFD